MTWALRLILGLAEMFRATTGRKWLVAADVDAKNHLRVLNGMMAAIGMVALWSCWGLPRARSLTEAIGVLMVFLVVARVYSMVVDGAPGRASKVYLGVETLLGAIFLGWPPPMGPSWQPV